MDNLTQQMDEIEALSAIYGDDWHVEAEEHRSYSIDIVNDNDKPIKFYLKLPDDYPSSSPPSYELFAPHWNFIKKQHIYQLLDEIYLSCAGENVIYQWIEKIREESTKNDTPNIEETLDNNDDALVELKIDEKNNNDEKCPDIYHGDVIVDRKSSFQGHAARVYSPADVKLVLKKLLDNKKIENATHNTYAYRITNDEKKISFQDCDDDGEHQAGGRLLHLLHNVNVTNIIVVVSRWYGGIKLGPDRFRHINNSARQVLEYNNPTINVIGNC